MAHSIKLNSKGGFMIVLYNIYVQLQVLRKHGALRMVC